MDSLHGRAKQCPRQSTGWDMMLRSAEPSQLVQQALRLAPGGVMGGFSMGADVGWEQKLRQVFNPREEKWLCSQGHKVLAHGVEIWGSR